MTIPQQSPGEQPPSSPPPSAPQYATPLPPGAPAQSAPPGRPGGGPGAAPGYGVPPGYGATGVQARGSGPGMPIPGYGYGAGNAGGSAPIPPIGLSGPARQGAAATPTGVVAWGIIALIGALAALVLLCLPGEAWVVAIAPAVIAVGAGAVSLRWRGIGRALGIAGLIGGSIAGVLICTTAVVVMIWSR